MPEGLFLFDNDIGVVTRDRDGGVMRAVGRSTNSKECGAATGDVGEADVGRSLGRVSDQVGVEQRAGRAAVEIINCRTVHSDAPSRVKDSGRAVEPIQGAEVA